MSDKMIPLASPNISDAAIDSVVSVLRTGMLVQGTVVKELEKNISQYLNISHCSAVSSGTSSLHLSLLALGVGVGDEVIIPALSYVATANVVELIGAKPIFVDVKKDFTIDPKLIEEQITEKTKAIIPVHEFGLSVDMDPIIDLAKKHNFFVIEDAACALGSTYKDKLCGTIGDFGSFSLHPRKAITSGEGGLITTSSQELDRKIRTLRNHGIQPDSYPMNFVEAGFNYRMTEFQAALVNAQLELLSGLIETRNELAKIYFNKIDTNNCRLPIVPEYAQTNWQTFHIVLQSEEQRNELRDYLMTNRIQSNYGAQCIPEMTFYKNKYDLDSASKFPNSYEAYIQGLAIPLYEKLTVENINYISDCINDFLKKWRIKQYS
ncbi:MAG: DegT/DnrJ/EryC1/StrS family aminotransferase [Ekhidna sp.]